MRVLGIDPGDRTGWAVYDDTTRRVARAGTVDGTAIPWADIGPVDVIAIERPEAYGPARPQVVDCAWTAGAIWADAAHHAESVVALTRRRVVRIVSDALGAQVRGDAQVWRALCDLHGGAKVAAAKGGPLHGVTSHARAALAVAYAAAQEVSP